jgi:AraC family transcriptional regulator
MSPLAPVRIVQFAETRVAALEHRGDPLRLGVSIRRFIEWRRQNRLPPDVSDTYNIVHDNELETPPARFRFDLCAATERDIEPNDFGIVAKIIPAGRCAVLRHVGSEPSLYHSVSYLSSQWLAESGEQRRAFPIFFHRISLVPEVSEQDAETDIYLPLR